MYKVRMQIFLREPHSLKINEYIYIYLFIRESVVICQVLYRTLFLMFILLNDVERLVFIPHRYIMTTQLIFFIY